MTDLELDIWNEWLIQKQKALEETLSTLSPTDEPYRYYLITGYIQGMIAALTMQATVEQGQRFQKKLNCMRDKLLASGDYDSGGNCRHPNS